MLERVRDFQQTHERRLEEEEQGGDDTSERMAQRMLELALLDEQGALSLDALTEQERAQFLGEVADGRLGKFVALWSPWWMLDERTYRRETSVRRRSLLMEEITTSEEEIKSTDDRDEIGDPVSSGAVMIQSEHAFPVRILTDKEAKLVPRDWSKVLPGGRAPAPSLRFHLVEVLFAYALTAVTSRWSMCCSCASRSKLSTLRVLLSTWPPRTAVWMRMAATGTRSRSTTLPSCCRAQCSCSTR